MALKCRIFQEIHSVALETSLVVIGAKCLLCVNTQHGKSPGSRQVTSCRGRHGIKHERTRLQARVGTNMWRTSHCAAKRQYVVRKHPFRKLFIECVMQKASPAQIHEKKLQITKLYYKGHSTIGGLGGLGGRKNERAPTNARHDGR